MKQYIDVDSFAGGGGASVGIESALGKPVDIAINHDAEAIAMHKANHPQTEHLMNDIWDVDPADIAARAPIRLAWFSPDCTHHSKARGKAPIRSPESQKSRDLAWVVIRWAKKAKPRIIMLENVEEFRSWCPLLENGKMDVDRKGETFDIWIQALRNLGYKVEWRELHACDYGAPTIRKRLFVIARRDSLPIVWPSPTHGIHVNLKPYRTAAECIDWATPIYSIFLSKEQGREVGVKRPLVEATMRRIGRGVWKYVINAEKPFVVPAEDGQGLSAPYFVPRYGEDGHQEPRTRSVEVPHPTIVPTGNGASLVAAFLAQHNTGVIGHDIRESVSTILSTGSHQNVVACNLIRSFGQSVGQEVDKPSPTTTAGGGGKTGLVTAMLTHFHSSNTNGGQGDLNEPMNAVLASGRHHALVNAFPIKYYGSGEGHAVLDAPCPTVTSKERFGLVTVEGQDYRIVDIAMRMLTARELFRAHGFDENYVIDPELNGKRLTKSAPIRMCGNSVCPQIAAALVSANIESTATYAQAS